jgi:hypothetical protein
MINHVKKSAFPILIKKWPMKYLLLTFTILVTLSFPAWSFENICPYKGQKKAAIARSLGLPDCAIKAGAVEIVVGRYCKNVGKRAYNDFGIKALREVYIGPIIGVAFKERGEVLTGSGHKEVRYVEITGLYYIIGPGGVADYTFLRYGPEIEGR